MGTDSTEESQLSLGFRVEQVVLKATSMGLGTFWIAPAHDKWIPLVKFQMTK